MKCLTPIKVYNNAHTLSMSAQTKMINYVPCGKCANCLINRKNEYMLRVNYEAKDTIQKHGYLIFDTLTYNENSVPWSKDVIKETHGIDIDDSMNFRCFKYRDFTLFMKKLRKDIYKKYKSKECVKYICVGEYGTEVGKTHRPHYHVIFFVKNPNINPIEFSYMISKNWNLGRTDGVKYKGKSYFRQKRLFYDSVEAVQNATGYIAKYITKDSEYSKKVRQKVMVILKKMCSIDLQYFQSYYGRLHALALCRELNQFQKQSQGFGLSALNNVDIKQIWKNGKISFDDKYKIRRSVDLPNYFYRKLFQYYDKTEKTWKYNELGKKYKVHCIQRTIDSMTSGIEKRLKSCFDVNLHEDNSYFCKDFIKQKDSEIINTINIMLNGRSIRNYVEYVIKYKDRIINPGNYIVSNLDSVIFNDSEKISSIATARERFDIGNAFVGNYVVDGFNFKDSLTYDKFIEFNTVNEDSNPAFKDFDKIGHLLYILDYKLNICRQRQYDKLQNALRKLKNAGLR